MNYYIVNVYARSFVSLHVHHYYFGNLDKEGCALAGTVFWRILLMIGVLVMITVAVTY